MNLPVMATVVRLRVQQDQRSLVRADGSRFTALLNADLASLYPDRAMRFCSLSTFADPSVPSPALRRTLLQTDASVDVTTTLDLVVPPTAAPTGAIVSSLSLLVRPSPNAPPTGLRQLPGSLCSRLLERLRTTEHVSSVASDGLWSSSLRLRQPLEESLEAQLCSNLPWCPQHLRPPRRPPTTAARRCPRCRRRRRRRKARAAEFTSPRRRAPTASRRSPSPPPPLPPPPPPTPSTSSPCCASTTR